MTIVPDFDRSSVAPVQISTSRRAQGLGGSVLFWQSKLVADVAGALLLVPVVIVLGALLLVLNPLFNPGPLIFRQRRMGRDCTSFVAFKFRTMTIASTVRGPDDPVEDQRITPLGRILRRTGLDELPQVFNVLFGEMSLIGPRPDCIHHAERFLAVIPEYRRRYCVRPGMSGLSQIRLGYVVGTEATRAKAVTDIEYIARASFALDLWIVWRTFITVVTGRGD